MRGRDAAPEVSNGINETVEKLFKAALAPATKRMYRRTLDDAAAFFGAPSIECIATPFQALDIVRYVAHMYNVGLSFPSILSRLSAISWWIKMRSWPLVTQTYMVSQALRGVKSLSKRPIKHKFPITPDVLRQLCIVIPSLQFPEAVAIRLKAMFLIAFHGFLRVGELCGSHHALLLSSVRIQSTCIVISFQSYKFSGGRCPHVFIPMSNSDICPVRSLQAYLNLRGNHCGFLFEESAGVPCSMSQFRSDLARVVKGAGLNNLGITPHSFRVGAATSAAALGIPADTIQRMGRWSSKAFLRYIKFQINRF